MVNISRWLFFFFLKGVLTCSFISAPTVPCPLLLSGPGPGPGLSATLLLCSPKGLGQDLLGKPGSTAKGKVQPGTLPRNAS